MCVDGYGTHIEWVVEIYLYTSQTAESKSRTGLLKPKFGITSKLLESRNGEVRKLLAL